jgi:acetoacetate decarboxylase
MGRVRYAKSPRDLERASAIGEDESIHAYQSIHCVYETDSEAVRAVVPRPLEANVHAEISVRFLSIASRIAMDGPDGPPDAVEVLEEIRSLRVGVRVDYDDKPGHYLLAVPMTQERAVLAGRERFGEPRKLAEIDFEVRGPDLRAAVERKGHRFLSLSGRRTEELGPRIDHETVYCFKAFPSCTPNKDFDQDPQLVRLEWQHRSERVSRVEGGLELQDSPFDPLVDLPVRRIVQFEYSEGVSSLSARALRPVPGDWLLAFLHQRDDDPWIEGLEV